MIWMQLFRRPGRGESAARLKSYPDERCSLRPSLPNSSEFPEKRSVESTKARGSGPSRRQRGLRFTNMSLRKTTLGSLSRRRNTFADRKSAFKLSKVHV